jgi:rare lipoprotein A (peptidoglycan hydrolase)
MKLTPVTDSQRYGNAGNQSPLCGKQVVITNTKNGKTVTVTVADDCPTCSGRNSIDLSEAAFKAIGSLDDGVEPISWHFAS